MRVNARTCAAARVAALAPASLPCPTLLPTADAHATCAQAEVKALRDKVEALYHSNRCQSDTCGKCTVDVCTDAVLPRTTCSKDFGTPTGCKAQTGQFLSETESSVKVRRVVVGSSPPHAHTCADTWQSVARACWLPYLVQPVPRSPAHACCAGSDAGVGTDGAQRGHHRGAGRQRRVL